MPRTSARKFKHTTGQRGTPTAKQPLGAAANPVHAMATGSTVTEMPRSADKPNSHSVSGGALLESGMREKLVREAAYFRAERRGFIPGQELEDWIAAEREVDQLLIAGKIVPVGFFG